MGRRAAIRRVVVGVALVALGGCASPVPEAATPASPVPPPPVTSDPAPSDPAPTAPSPPAEPSPSPTPADLLASMTPAERVGQLFMVGAPADGDDAIARRAVSDDRVGAVFLHGRSSDGVDATAQRVARFTGVSTSPSALWVATDQEGGEVQLLTGPGFDPMPSALRQGRLDDATLRSDAERWGAELAMAGVNVNLAPVADIVSHPDAAAGNPPIGALDRAYGFDAETVAAKAGAFAHGMRDAGVVPTLKHFPGLGYVTANPDYASGVVDDVVTSDGPDLEVYRRLLADGPAIVMMSTVVYARIDPDLPAAFSATALALLRDELGFDGVVMTDDLSAATEVAQWSPAERATLAIDAGVDLLLVSRDPSVYDEMHAAVLQRAQDDPGFAAKVDAAARRIVAAKAG